MKLHCILALALAFAAALHAEPPKPLKALLVTGGAAHDYAKQKDILKKGIEERANVSVTLLHCEDKTMKPVLPFLENPELRGGYDVIIYDVCAPGVNAPDAITALLKPHQDGVPAVVLHAAALSFRSGSMTRKTRPSDENGRWHELVGVQNAMHGAQAPMALTFTGRTHPIAQGLADWTTIPEELYPVVQVLPTATALVSAEQMQTVKKKQPDGTETTESRQDTAVVAWANVYRGRTRVFGTSIGHNNTTVADARYLDLVTNGLLWAVDKLDANGKPHNGYEPNRK